MSGKYAHTHGVWRLRGDLPPGCRIFPGLLREAGYDTGFVGKWHLGVESEKPNPAFNYWAGFRDQGAYFDPLLNVSGTPTPTKGYVTDILTDHAEKFSASIAKSPSSFMSATKLRMGLARRPSIWSPYTRISRSPCPRRITRTTTTNRRGI